MAPARQSAEQRRRDAAASKITGLCKWRISRQNRRPRGLSNVNETCYQNAALQMLLHLPKFIAWIMQHNAPGQNWPCAAATMDSNQAPPPKYSNEPAIKKLGAEGMGCVPCLLKDLIRGYWGDALLDAATGEPDALPPNHVCWHRLHQLARRWNYREPYNLPEILAGARKKMRRKLTAAETLKYTQEARAENMDSQQDSDEFFRTILDGIEKTYAHRTPVKAIPTKRKTQYDSLFTRTVVQTHTCTHCNYTHAVNSTDELGVRISAEPPGTPDSLPAAIARSLTDDLERGCEKCSTVKTPLREHMLNTKWLTAPEYLYVLNSVQAYDENGNVYKNRNPIDIPETLDVTQHMTMGSENNEHPDPIKVRYTLKHVVYHAGTTINVGHYVAGITQMPRSTLNSNPKDKEGEGGVKEWFCDDSQVFGMRNRVRGVAQGENVLTVNPVDVSTRMVQMTEFDPVMILYERIRTKPRSARVPRHKEKAVEGCIAQSVKNNPRDRQTETR
ncbi:hypothetical protein BDU57DRAFT_528474 [Ampelomyces quisqualis]|uniref:ubiquitinyl hydrolase 1 n=1 Tax=Ampelomyces quisqualis TaxID=50730 RepID=A0A6A5QTQ7_AMPQU|nr:hypothetical protein BDU57DRAFT_528474 [Ampelomyces quisqualis]